MNNEIRKKVLKSCVSIWLKSKFKKLIKRYKKNNRRPLLNRKKLDADVKKYINQGKKFTALANFKINCDNMNKSKIVVQKILNFYEN